MIWRFLFLLITLTSWGWSSGPKYSHSPATLDDEITNIYHDIESVLLGDVRISSVTVGTITVNNLAMISSSTVNNLTAHTLTVDTLATISSATIADLTYVSLHPSISVTGTIGSAYCVTQTTQTTTTSTSFVTTGLIISITPSATTSRIAIFAVGTIGIVQTQNSDNVVSASIHRGTTDLSNGEGFATFDVNLSAAQTNTYNNIPVGIGIIDTPESTSTLSYSVRLKTNNGAITARWNNWTGESSLCVMELKL